MLSNNFNTITFNLQLLKLICLCRIKKNLIQEIMNYEIQKLEKSEVKITIELGEDELKKYEEEAIKELSKKVEVKGFRKGHIPEEVLKQKLGETHIKEEAKEKAIQRNYIDVIMKEKIDVIASPRLSIDSEKPFKFSLTVAIFPETKLEGIDDIKVKIEETKLGDNEVEELIQNFKARKTTWIESDKEAKKGDKIEMDFEGFDKDGKAVENTKSTNHPIVLGEGMIVKSFEDQLFGLKKGDKKDLLVKFPNDYHKKDFQGMSFTFKTEIKKIENPILPELDEKFVKEISGKDQSVEDFKLEVRKALEEQKKTENRQKAEDEFISKLIEKVEVEIPEIMLTEELNHIMHEFEDRLKTAGMDLQMYLKQNNLTDEKLKEKYTKEAEKRLKARLSLRKAMEIKKIDVEESEITEELNKLKSYYSPEDHKKIEQDFKEGNLKATIANRIAIKKFFDQIFNS